jgi:hypothetical protein
VLEVDFESNRYTLFPGKSGKWRVRSWRSGVGYTKFDYVSVTQ